MLLSLSSFLIVGVGVGGEDVDENNQIAFEILNSQWQSLNLFIFQSPA